MTKRSIGLKDPFDGFAYPHQLSLSERIDIEKTTWHWFPYKRINYHITETGEFVEEECDESHAIDDFPEDLFTRKFLLTLWSLIEQVLHSKSARICSLN